MKKVKCTICNLQWGVSCKADVRLYVCPRCAERQKLRKIFIDLILVMLILAALYAAIIFDILFIAIVTQVIAGWLLLLNHDIPMFKED